MSFLGRIKSAFREKVEQGSLEFESNLLIEKYFGMSPYKFDRQVQIALNDHVNLRSVTAYGDPLNPAEASIVKLLMLYEMADHTGSEQHMYAVSVALRDLLKDHQANIRGSVSLEGHTKAAF